MQENTRFLFVDDSEMDHFYIQALIEIEQIPISAHFSSNAKNALRYLRKIPKEVFPQVIISDVQMPEVSGPEFIRQFQKEFLPLYPETIIFFTSSFISSDRARQLKETPNISGIIKKPFMKGHFEKTIIPLLDYQPQFI